MPRQPDITKARIRDFLDQPLTVTEFLGKGGDGIVYKGFLNNEPQQPLAVKFYVPLPSSLFEASVRQIAFVKDFDNRYKAELQRLRDVTHPNLQRYISCGKLSSPPNYFANYGVGDTSKIDIPFIITRYVEGHSLDTVLRAKEKPSRYSLVTNLLQLALAIQYLHHKKLIHGDVKIQNVLIETSPVNAVLIDFGFSKSFLEEDPVNTSFFLDPRKMPPSVRRILEQYIAPDHTCVRSQLRALLFPALDLYQFGLLLEELLQTQEGILNSFDREYLSYISNDLQSWSAELLTDGSSLTTHSGYIKSARQLVERLQRLEHGPYYYQHAFAHFESAAPQVIVRPDTTVEIRQSIAPLLGHPTLRRLHNLSQLSMVRYIYPSATQSRFDHLLSALGVCQQMWKALSRSARFLFHMEPGDVDKMEVLALLHDINHFPFLHYFQEAGIPAIKSAPIIETFLGDIPQQLYGAKTSSLLGLLQSKGVNISTLQRLISDDLLTDGQPAECITKSVLNGGIDADKLAYLRDDARTTGLPFGLGIDIAGLLDGIDVDLVSAEQGAVWHIVFPYTAIPAIEGVCFARYWNFQRIYWHHTNRAVEAMIIWTIQELYSRPDKNALDFLRDTKHQGDAGALEYLADEFLRAFETPAPISGLVSNRDRIYKRVFELPLIGHEQLLNAFLDDQHGLARRTAALKQISGIIQAFAREKGYKEKILDGEVLLDIPLRKMDLGGPIYIRTAEGEVKPAVAVSPLLSVLHSKFGDLSKVLRVFVSPRIRDKLGKEAWEAGQSQLRISTMQALISSQSKSEIK
jgi:serine/threonine protein kinase